MNPDPSQPEVKRFEPESADADLWARFHAFRRKRHAERTPDEPLRSDETVEGQMKIESRTWYSHHFHTQADGRMVGFAEFESPKPDAPEYASNRHLVYASIGVIEPYRGRGHGRALLGQLLAEMEARGARVATCWTSEEDGHAFAEHLGCRPTQVERMSRLDLEALDWDMVARWVADLPRRAPGTTLELYPDRLPEAFLEEYAPARTRLLNLMPWDDTDHGEIVVTPDDFREMARRLDVSRTEHHTYITREPDGTISGITDMAWSPENPHDMDQWFTGVDPAYRGRGLGKALKAAMLLYCAGRYEDLKWIRTGNATTNAAMLAINEALGFEEYRRYTTYQLDRDALGAHLAGSA